MKESSAMIEFVQALPRRMAVALLSAPIHGYRYLISPLLAPSCRFAPTCSCYALEALSRHGPFKGSWLALCRLARCHPIRYLGGGQGYDPVPRHGQPR